MNPNVQGQVSQEQSEEVLLTIRRFEENSYNEFLMRLTRNGFLRNLGKKLSALFLGSQKDKTISGLCEKFNKKTFPDQVTLQEAKERGLAIDTFVPMFFKRDRMGLYTHHKNPAERSLNIHYQVIGALCEHQVIYHELRHFWQRTTLQESIITPYDESSDIDLFRIKFLLEADAEFYARKLMYWDYLDKSSVFQGMSDAQKNRTLEIIGKEAACRAIEFAAGYNFKKVIRLNEAISLKIVNALGETFGQAGAEIDLETSVGAIYLRASKIFDRRRFVETQKEVTFEDVYNCLRQSDIAGLCATYTKDQLIEVFDCFLTKAEQKAERLCDDFKTAVSTGRLDMNEYQKRLKKLYRCLGQKAARAPSS